MGTGLPMTVQDWVGLPVAEPSGRRYARLDELFVGRQSGAPEFGIVSLDAEGTERVAVPLHEAEHIGDALLLPYDVDRVVAAPRVQGPVEEIPADAGRRVLEFFGAGPSDAAPTAPLPAAEPAGEEETEVIVSEEQLQVDTRVRATERVRVRKAVVTEEVTVTVTVRREELIIDREPVGEAAAAEGFDFAAPLAPGGELEILLHAEEPVVSKRVVPVERIRLHRNTIVEQERITDTVRKERVEIDETPITEQEPTP